MDGSGEGNGCRFVVCSHVIIKNIRNNRCFITRVNVCFSVSKSFLKALKACGCATRSLFVLYIFYFFLPSWAEWVVCNRNQLTETLHPFAAVACLQLSSVWLVCVFVYMGERMIVRTWVSVMMVCTWVSVMIVRVWLCIYGWVYDCVYMDECMVVCTWVSVTLCMPGWVYDCAYCYWSTWSVDYGLRCLWGHGVLAACVTSDW